MDKVRLHRRLDSRNIVENTGLQSTQHLLGFNPLKRLQSTQKWSSINARLNTDISRIKKFKIKKKDNLEEEDKRERS